MNSVPDCSDSVSLYHLRDLTGWRAICTKHIAYAYYCFSMLWMHKSHFQVNLCLQTLFLHQILIYQFMYTFFQPLSPFLPSMRHIHGDSSKYLIAIGAFLTKELHHYNENIEFFNHYFTLGSFLALFLDIYKSWLNWFLLFASVKKKLVSLWCI